MSDVGKTVKEWVESCCGRSAFEFDDQIERIKDLKVVRTYDGRTHAFPQTRFRYRNVMNWVLLDNGTSLGWNESPRSGWSFVRSGAAITGKYLDHFEKEGI